MPPHDKRAKVGKPDEPAEFRLFDDNRLYRYNDLEEIGFVSNWPTLRNWQDKFGFPPGRLVGRNSHLDRART